MNPFIIQGYWSKEYFCDRVNETEKITRALNNGNNVTLISGRRKGKSSLIKHVLKNNFSHYIYFDIYDVLNYNEFSIKLSQEIIKQYGKPEAGFLKSISKFLTGIRPIFSFDQLTGEPQLSIQELDTNNPINTIEELFNFLKSEQKEIVIAIDEFQEICNWNKGAEALMRGLVQSFPEIRFVFSGSNRKLMLEMFTNSKRPFYHSSEILVLGKIDSIEYEKFIIGHIHGKFPKIKNELVISGISLCRGETYYIQRFFNRIYSLENEIKIDELAGYFKNFVWEKESEFQHQISLFPKTQKELLKAIAKNNGVEKPTSKDFTIKYNLATSSVNQNIQALIDKDMIEKENEKFIISDVFLNYWLKNI